MKSIQRKFKDSYELHNLKYFNLNEKDQLVINRDEYDGPIIDFHTHLGMTFLLAPRLQLNRRVPKVEFFFPYRGNEVDLDVYAAKSFTKESADKTRYECGRAAWSAKGYMATHTVPNILEDMDRMNVSHSLLLAIEYPFHLSNNSEYFIKATEGETRLPVFGSVHPAMRNMEAKIDRLIHMGCLGLKLHPPQQMFYPNSKRAYAIYEICRKKRFPVFFHTGDSDIAPKLTHGYPAVKHFIEPVRDFPDLYFIFGHAGIHYYKELVELAAKHDNVIIECSGQPPHRIREMIDGAGSDRICFGSDWAFYSIEFPLAKALIATEGNPVEREKLLFGNAERLLEEFGAKM